MATPADLIKGALTDLGILASGEALSAADQETGRLKLNQMLDAWNLEGLLVYATTRTTKVLTPADGDYTIGSGGDINVVQPVAIDDAGIIYGGMSEEPLRILTASEWAAVVDKTTQGIPYALFLQRAANATARGTVFLYYVPDAAYTLALYLRSQFASVAVGAIATSYYLLPGYELAIQSNLAIALAPAFGFSVSAELALIAQESKASVKRSNPKLPLMRSDEALLSYPPGFVDRAAFNSGGF